MHMKNVHYDAKHRRYEKKKMYKSFKNFSAILTKFITFIMNYETRTFFPVISVQLKKQKILTALIYFQITLN